MKNIKKLVSLLLVGLLLLSVLAPLVYADVEDVPSTWARDSVSNFRSLGLLPLSLDNNYSKPITRQEFTSLIIPLVENIIGSEIEILSDEFLDTKDSNVLKASTAEIVTGVGGNKFNPNGYITREQVSVMFSRSLNYMNLFTKYSETPYDSIILSYKKPSFTDFNTISDWAQGSVTLAVNNKIISGVSSNRYDPKGNLTREQAITIANRVYTNLKTTNFVKNLVAENKGYIANTFSQALYLGSNNGRFLVSSLDSLIGQDIVAIEKLYGKYDKVGKDTFVGYDAIVYEDLELTLYFKDYKVIGFSVNHNTQNITFKGTFRGWEKQRDFEIFKKNNPDVTIHFDGEVREDINNPLIKYSVGYNVAVIYEGSKEYLEIIWNASDNSIVGMTYIANAHTYKPAYK